MSSFFYAYTYETLFTIISLTVKISSRQLFYINSIIYRLLYNNVSGALEIAPENYSY